MVSLAAQTASRMERRRAGFSMVELLFVLLIAGILGTLAFPSFKSYLSHRALVNARTAFTAAAARARAAAVERGDVVVLRVLPTADAVHVMSADGADTLMTLDLADGEMTADLLREGGNLTVCYLPRGFAHPSCGDGASLPQQVGFRNAAGNELWASISAVGQVEHQ